LGVAVLAIVSWTAGGWVRRYLPARPDAEYVALRTYSGLALVAVFVLLSGSISLRFAWMALTLAAIAAIVRTGLRWARDGARERSFLGRPESRFAAIAIGVVVAANFVAFLASQAPVTSWDAGTAHLAVPASYSRAGHIGLDEGNVYSAYPQLLHTLYALEYSVDGERGVSTVSWGLCVLACVATYGLGKRVGGEVAGAVAAALLATSPIYAAQAGTVAIDVPFAGLIAAALGALVAWMETRRPIFLAFAGIIAGSACGIRHTGYLVVVFALIWIVTDAKETRLRSGVLFAVCAVFASAPWWLRSWWLVGNPVYPLLTGVFGDGGMPDVQVTAPLQHETARSAGILDVVTFPWRILMHPDQFDGWQASPGGLTLTLGVVGMVVGGRIARRLGAFSLAGFVTIYMVQRLARYLLPFFLPLHVLSGVAVAELRALRRPITGLLAFAYIYGLVLAAGMMHFKLPAALGLESRDDYLSRRLERYPAFEWAHRNIPADATVLSLDPRGYYLHRHTFTNLALLSEIAKESPEARTLWMKQHGIRYIFVPEAYVESSPIFREWGIAPLIDGWRNTHERFVPVYDAPMEDVRSGGVERVTMYEVVWGDAGEHP